MLPVWLSIPLGGTISDQQFELRHRLIVWFLGAHAPVLFLIAVLRDFGVLHAFVESSPAVILALVARFWRANHFARASVAALGLVVAASILVHFTGGLIESHFHWFVVLSFVSLYVDVRPFLVALGYTVLHHGGMSMYDPTLVFSTESGQANPWLWTLIHVVFVVMLIAAIVANWLTLEHQNYLQDQMAQRQRSMITQQEEVAVDVRQRATALNRETDDVRSMIDKMASSISTIDDGGQRVGELANQATDRASRAEGLSSETQTVVSELVTQSMQIADLVAVVEEIASRTTLLALNASIEAARAGEAGRGFAVVATEVQALAGTTRDATEKISAVTDTISSQLDRSQSAIEDVVRSVQEIEELQAQVATELTEQISASTRMRNDVGDASSTMDTMAAEVDGLANVLEHAHRTAASQG